VAEDTEIIAELNVGNATSLLATLEEEIGSSLQKLGGGVTSEVKSGLLAMTMRPSAPGQPADSSSQAVFVLLRGGEEEITRSRSVIEGAANRHRLNARFLSPGNREFEVRRRTTFGKLRQGAI
jgi:hypothetical protein